ncbi:MAG: class I SAM-dependent methyltransferase [Deltaproteobacteria bacterium]|nr:class I SAM-dependent methyltransferase [Deltaproteobacteria bacterium]
MGEINLLDSLPKTNRSSRGRVVTPADRKLACQFGKEYFDGPRTQGYGGYIYDGRWKPVAKRLKAYYHLPDSARVLDVGCAKGFLLHDLKELMPHLEIAGVDISQYAIQNSVENVRPFLSVGNANKIPWPDRYFDLVLSINTIHNLDLNNCKMAIREIQRVSKKYTYIVVDAYRDELEKQRLLDWILTAKTFMHVDKWENLFQETGYKGDYYWFLME